MALRRVKLLATARRWTIPNLKQFRESRQPTVWLLAPLIGLATGVAAIGFRLAIGAFQWPWLQDMSENVAMAAREQSWWVIVLAPAAGGLLVGLMLQYLLIAKRTDAVPDVMEARLNAGRGLSLSQGLLSALASALSLGVGAIVRKPWVMADDRIEARDVLHLTLLMDHDVVDGADMARFVAAFVEGLESARGLEPSEPG